MEPFGEMIDDTTVRFERLLPGPIDRVWAYLTDGDKRARWLCGGQTELTVGGAVEMRFHNARLSTDADIERPEKYREFDGEITFGGQVTEVDPPRLLAHTWEFHGENSVVRYELEQQGENVRLVLTHSKLNSLPETLSVCGGWHTHLGILLDILQGIEPRPFWKTHTEYEAQYEARLEL